MAKWGEGDARWQVSDLGVSGRNVNGWHWVEKDALPWCQERLQELLGAADLAPGSGLSVRCTGLKSCEGEAVVNNRKNKIIAAYELAVVLGWECGNADGADAAVSGEVRLPYVSEENHDEDPEMQVATSMEGAAAQKAKQAILTSGKKVIHDALATFVSELRAGGPMRSDAARPKTAPEKAVDAVAAATERASSSSAAAAGAAAQAPAADEKAADKAAASGHSIKLKEKFFARAEDIFECFTVPPRIMAFTQSPAEAEPRPGGRFSMFGGSVQGVFREVEPAKRIVMDWRFSNWEDGVFSRLELDFAEPDRGNAVVSLKQTGIPDADRFGNHDVVGVTEAGWKNQVFGRIRAVFGYGI